MATGAGCYGPSMTSGLSFGTKYTELIHNYIRTLTPATSDLRRSEYSGQDFHSRAIVRKHLAACDVFTHLRMQALDHIGRVDQPSELDGVSTVMG